MNNCVSRNYCSYCGLAFTGTGYSSGSKNKYCCYGCYLVERITGSSGDEGIASWILIRLGIGAFLSMNVMMLSMLLYIESPSSLGVSTVNYIRLVLAVIAAPAMVILGTPLALGAAKSMIRRRFTMDAFIVITSAIAYAVSAYHVYRNDGHIYFDTATMLLLIVTLGRLLEASAKTRASRSIKDVLNLTPPTAWILRDDKEYEIPASDVQPGDIVVIKPGERIPADGEIISGCCLIEEAAFTGESKPRSCGPGDTVYGGSINCDGYIKVGTTAVGDDSLLGQIQTMVREALDIRAPIERAAERATAVFVPIVWIVAVAAALYWGVIHGDPGKAMLSSLAVMVVACPCALGIATPIATSLALSKAASSGVLIRSGEVLEMLSDVKSIYFDKTGTLTHNNLSVSEVITASPDISVNEALLWAASLETASEHSLSRAVIQAANDNGVEIGTAENVTVHPGQGLEGTVILHGSRKHVIVGSLSLIKERLTVPDSLDLGLDKDPLTAIYVGWEGNAHAVILITDSARCEAREVVNDLADAGVESIIISGDREGPVKRVAEALGIKQSVFACPPTEKAAVIRKARSLASGKIAMAGDGINDAPALAEADAGIAVAGGTDLARQASDVVLMGQDLSRIPWVLSLSKATYRVIRRNLYWAFGYNSIAIVLAFLGYAHPLIAATAMFLSSIAVLSSSLSIINFTDKQREDTQPFYNQA